MYLVTKWNPQWNVKGKSEILSYMKKLVARFTAYLSVCMQKRKLIELDFKTSRSIIMKAFFIW